MHWIAPSEKDTANGALEKRLWDAADQFRANSGLKAQEYSGPILGLIFLRFAEARFAAQRAKLEKAGASSRRGSRMDDSAAYHADGILYLPAEARFDYLLRRPEAEDIGAKVNAAMRDIEKNNPQLAGVLPKTYNLFTSTLLKDLLKKVSEIPASVDFDAFGRIYEYFLGEFARTEGQKGGEFYTPSCIVRLLTEIIEPYHGRILDPACGSGGMFVSSARFVAEHQKNPAAELSICGVEKTDETGRLCRLNLAVHGLEGDIRHGGNVNSYYDDPHTATGAFDFVLANPPFNVNAVDKDRLKDMVGAGRRFPFGLPKPDNANYIWIQLFYSALNPTGRAGFVMANSASDARASEQELRQKLIEARAVDVMVAVGPNMFYTVTLPCTLWFPPLPVQHRIAGILSAYDELIENSQRRIKILESMARALYREWFVHFRFPGHENHPRVASPLGDIPQDWEVRTVKDVATVTYGFPFQSEKFNTDGRGTPVIRIRDILNGSINTFTDEETAPKYHIRNGDILVGMDGDFHMCMWSSGHAFQNQRVAKFESKGEIGNYHLFLSLELPIQTWNKSIVGTTVAHLGDTHIKAIRIAWPPSNLRAKTREVLEPMSEQIIALKRQIQNLRRTRDLLLPRLLSGQIDIAGC